MKNNAVLAYVTPPLKRFRLLVQHITFHAGSKTSNNNIGLDFWTNEEGKFSLLAPQAQDLLSTSASQKSQTSR